MSNKRHRSTGRAGGESFKDYFKLHPDAPVLRGQLRTLLIAHERAMLTEFRRIADEAYREAIEADRRKRNPWRRLKAWWAAKRAARIAAKAPPSKPSTPAPADAVEAQPVDLVQPGA